MRTCANPECSEVIPEGTYAQKKYCTRKCGERHWRRRNPEAAYRHRRKADLKRNYGITMGAYDLLFKAQDGKCAVCGEEGSKALAVDHCHISGSVRGLLCAKCNKALGLLKEDPKIIMAAAAYVRRGLRREDP